MAAAVGPFIADHAGRFAQELVGFLSSNLSVAGHDHLVFGVDEPPSSPPQRLHAGIGQTTNASPLLIQQLAVLPTLATTVPHMSSLDMLQCSHMAAQV